MGCGSSKPDNEEEIPAGIRPGSRTEEIPKPEEYDLPSEEEKGIIVIEEVKKVDGEKKEWDELEVRESPSFRFYFTDMIPFDSDDDDDSVRVIQEITNEELALAKEGEEKKGKHERECSHESLSSNEEEYSDSKLVKKERGGGRFKALTTAPSQVYSFLTVRK